MPCRRRFEHNDTRLRGRLQLLLVLAALPLGEWSGPLESPFGLHLVVLDGRLEGESPGLEEVRRSVVRDWTYTRRGEAEQRFHDELLSRYQVSVEWPEVPAGESAEQP